MGGRLSDNMLAALFCDRLGWTWQEYMEQPDFMIQAIMTKWACDAEHQKEANKQ